MILYPTETLYALGVNAFDAEVMQQLAEFKGRGSDKFTSMLVRDVSDIKRWAILSPAAEAVATHFLPGPLTLVLSARETLYNLPICAPDKTVSFRISSDPVAKQVITDFISKYDAPLTCTSANVSGEEPANTPQQILKQFTDHHRDIQIIDKVIDDGLRTANPSTVVRVINDTITIHRAGAIPEHVIMEFVSNI